MRALTGRKSCFYLTIIDLVIINYGEDRVNYSSIEIESE